MSIPNETSFRQWYKVAAKRLKLNPDPDDPRHWYDYRKAYKEGVNPPSKLGGHWPSKYKRLGHPRYYIGREFDF